MGWMEGGREGWGGMDAGVGWDGWSSVGVCGMDGGREGGVGWDGCRGGVGWMEVRVCGVDGGREGWGGMEGGGWEGWDRACDLE